MRLEVSSKALQKENDRIKFPIKSQYFLSFQLLSQAHQKLKKAYPPLSHLLLTSLPEPILVSLPFFLLFIFAVVCCVQLNECNQLDVLLIMHKTSFHLQGWDTEEIAPPLSHRLQLQPLQEIITKGQANSPLSLAKKHPFPSAKVITKSIHPFRSITVSRKNIKTQPERVQLKTLSQPTGLILQDRLDQQQCNGLFKRTQANGLFFKSIISFIQKEGTAKKSPKFMLENNKQQQIYFPKNKRHSRSMNALLKPQNPKLRERLQNISKYKIHFRNEEGRNSKHISISKEQSLRKLKKFFLQTLQGIQTRNKDKFEKTHESRLKNMLERSNRKKKQIEELFKTRIIIGKNQQQRRQKHNKIHKFLLEPEQRVRMKSKASPFQNQFDDQSLFCPWNYKHDKIINYLNAKHNS